MELGKFDLKNIQIEILEKFFRAFDKIPISVLEQFPQFDAQMCQRLRSLNQRVKAKILQTERKLKNIYSQEENETVLSKNQHYSQNCNLNDSIDNRDVEINYKDTSPSTDSVPRCTEISLRSRGSDNELNRSTSIDESISIFNNIHEVASASTLKPHEFSLERRISQDEQTSHTLPFQKQKKSKFQLKMPVKATIDPAASKQIEKMYEKCQQSRNSNYVPMKLNESDSKPEEQLTNPIKNTNSQNRPSSAPVSGIKSELNIPKSTGFYDDYEKNPVAIKKSNPLENELEYQISSWSAFGKVFYQLYKYFVTINF